MTSRWTVPKFIPDNLSFLTHYARFREQKATDACRDGWLGVHIGPQDNAEDVEAAIEAGAHINGRVAGETPADSGQTAVIKAVRLGCLEVLDLLMQKGADPYMKDDLFRDAWCVSSFF